MGSNGRVCKLEKAFKSMQLKGTEPSASSSAPPPNYNVSKRQMSGSTTAVNGHDQTLRINTDDYDYKLRRMEEKAEMLLHFIFWGPN
ncbi:conserved hypothetical protein [Ricinus communis]|uniref:Uncharacterized protein n=1 Tax=Ricinus communis TaxID=3988 RepID=B9SIE9_RICCO|nr:conserved hypothetical protein [Ricinus communis]